MILYSHNKTSSWLEKQSSEDRKKLFQAAQTMAPIIKTKFNERQQRLEGRHEQTLFKKQEIVHKAVKVIPERDQLTKEINLWINTGNVERGLEMISKKAEKLKSLKTQIHKVLGKSHSDNAVFKFSHGGKAHSVQTLKQNLLSVTDDKRCTPVPDYEQDNVLSPEDLIKQPESLGGGRIKHRFEVDGKLVWYRGTVLQLNYVTNEFEVAYDDEDDVCWFPLIDDLRNGDLFLA